MPVRKLRLPSTCEYKLFLAADTPKNNLLRLLPATCKLHSEEFPAALLHAQTDKQLFCTIAYSLTMGQRGPKHVVAGVFLYHHNLKLRAFVGSKCNN